MIGNEIPLNPAILCYFHYIPFVITYKNHVSLEKQKLDAGWPESEEGQVGNVKLEEEVRRRSNEDNQVK